MENLSFKELLKCDGKRFRCKIVGKQVEGRVKVKDDVVYLCQNERNGAYIENKFGYKYSWGVYSNDLEENDVTDFQLLSYTAEEIEAYKDCQVGDRLHNAAYSDLIEVIFRSGELVVCKVLDTNAPRATGAHTCDSLHFAGWRLIDHSTPYTAPVEVTLSEIAQWKGVSIERIKIKEE